MPQRSRRRASRSCRRVRKGPWCGEGRRAESVARRWVRREGGRGVAVVEVVEEEKKRVLRRRATAARTMTGRRVGPRSQR